MLKILTKTYRIAVYALHYIAWRAQNSNAIQHCSIDTEDCQLHYKVFGTGEPLVLLHGGLTSIEVWLCQIPSWSKKFHIIAIDARGHGRSTIGNKKLSYRLMAKDVIAILDQEGIEQTHVAGWSDGGNTGLIMSVLHTERINKVIVMSANYHTDGLKKSALESSQLLSKPKLLSPTRWWHWLHTKQNHLWVELRMRTHAMWQTYPQLTHDDLSRITSPVLILIGEHDLISIDHAREMEKHIPKAKLIILERCGHNVLFEEPTLIINVVEAFILGNNMNSQI